MVIKEDAEESSDDETSSSSEGTRLPSECTSSKTLESPFPSGRTSVKRFILAFLADTLLWRRSELRSLVNVVS